MKKCLVFLLVAFSTQLVGQKGDFLLTQHQPSYSNIDNYNFEIISDNNGLICIANRSGVLTYDGDDWDFFSTPSAALSLDVDDNNMMYVGCIDSYGIIDFNENKLAYQSLIESDSINDLFLQTIDFGDHVYFLGNHNLVIFNKLDRKSTIVSDNFLNIYRIEDNLFVNSEDQTYLIQQDSLVEHQTAVKVSSSHHYGRKPPIIVDFDGKMHVWDERMKNITHNKLIEENGFEIVEAKWINDSLFACSTFSSGVIFLNYNDINYFEVVDYHSGLPDNEIYALQTDINGNVWIAHPFGFTSVSPLFPAVSFSNYPGLKGNLTGIFQKKDDIWVTSSLGLFHFDKDTLWKNQVYYTKVQKRRPTKTTVTKAETKPKQKKKFNIRFGKKRNNQTTNKKKKGLLASLKEGIEEIFDNPNNVERVSRNQARNTSYKRNIRKVPVKVNFRFSKVDGTDAKFFKMLEYGEHLLLIGNSGIYEVDSENAHLVIAENVRFATVLSSGQLLISTSDHQLKTFILENEIWIEQASEEIEDIIVNMIEDGEGRIWLAGSTSLYNLSVSDSTLSFSNTFALSNQNLDDVDILERQDTVYFINSNGYFYYDAGIHQILENRSLADQIGLPVTSISDRVGKSVWIHNGKSWFMIPSKGTVRQFEYLSLFQDLVSISKDLITEEYWLLTRDNQLLKFNPSNISALASHQLFVKKVSNPKGDISIREKFALSYDDNFLTVELSKPDYLGLLNPEFQYKLQGLHTEWSDWTRSKSIDFSYLPPGQYSLLVKSKDAFDRIEEANLFTFKVKDPYWQQPWFYALQVIFFGGLVVLSLRMNQKKSQNRLLSGALSVLTLVLIIEFLQSAAGAFLNIQSTPVVDFLIDAFVALLIFPLEKFLREFLSKGKVDVKSNSNPKKLRTSKARN